MLSQNRDTVLIITPFAEKMGSDPVLGTGGWLPPEEREVLDWKTLIALMGWETRLLHPERIHLDYHANQQIKWIIVTGDPDIISSKSWEQLLSIASTNKVLLFTAAGEKNGWLSIQLGVYLATNESSGTEVEYSGQGHQRKWGLTKPHRLKGLELTTDVTAIVRIDDTCITASVKYHGGKILFLSFQASCARDTDSCFTALLKHLMIYESTYPVAWFDWTHTMILRMDDPGSAQAAYDNGFQNTKLGERDWELIGEELANRNARMSIAYVSAWVDDGNEERGQFEVDGIQVNRELGKLYNSPSVKYIKKTTEGELQVFDNSAEFRGIQKLRNAGLAETELHGHTHIHPERRSWGLASDKYDNKKWYREFSRSCVAFINTLPLDQHPLHLGVKAFIENFQSTPSTLICPGEEFTNDVLDKAMKAGFSLVSSYYLGMRIGDQLCWNQHVCSPYLDDGNARWFDAELPVVGYFHDFDLSIKGVNWFSDQLTNWESAGAKFFIDFRELSHILSNTIGVTTVKGQLQLHLSSENKLPFLRPVRMGIYFPGQNITKKIIIKDSQEIFTIDLEELAEIDLLDNF